MDTKTSPGPACLSSPGAQKHSESPSIGSDIVHCHWGQDRKQYVFSRAEFDTACDFLCRVWDIPSLRPQQKQALEALFRGQDTLALLPTGFGKTLAFEGLVVLFDYLFNGAPHDSRRKHRTDAKFCNPVIIVISPLTQLILRQVQEFNSKMQATCPWLNAICAYTADGTPAAADSAIARAVYGGKANIVCLSPGHVTGKGRYRNILNSAAYTGRVIAFIVDEVHCVHHWGFDFRPEYSLLSTSRALLGYDVPCGGFTATLTPEDQRDVIASLALRDVITVQVSPDRPNIFLRCVPFDHTIDEFEGFGPLISELREHKSLTPKLLVYVKDKTRAERYWSYLSDEILSTSRTYPGGHLLVNLVSGDLNPSQVKEVTDHFMEPTCLTRVLISSEVLGMGIDIKGLTRVWVIGQFGTLKEYVFLLSACCGAIVPTCSLVCLCSLQGLAVVRQMWSGRPTFRSNLVRCVGWQHL